MKYIEIEIMVHVEEMEHILVTLEGIGLSRIWIEDEQSPAVIKAYISEYEEIHHFIQPLKREIARMGLNDVKVVLHDIDDTVWENEWKKYYVPKRVTNQITVVPSWEEYRASPKELVVYLDPGMAFGDGWHPTTVLAIRLMEKHMRREGLLLDVGCGSGILSVVAAKLGMKKVYALDIDPLAVEKTKENVRVNAVENVVDVRQGDLVSNVSYTFDCIVANILSDEILHLSQNLHNVLNKEGIFLFSGVIKDREKEVMEALRDYRMLERITMENWVAAAFQRC